MTKHYIYVYKRKDNGSWVVRYRPRPGMKYTCESFVSKEDADNRAKVIELKMCSGTFTQKRDSSCKHTFAEMYSLMVTEKKKARKIVDKTIFDYNNMINDFVSFCKRKKVVYIEDMVRCNITQEYFNSICDTKAPKTIWNYAGCFSSVFSFAMTKFFNQERIISFNPISVLNIPKKTKTFDKIPYSNAEKKAIFQRSAEVDPLFYKALAIFYVTSIRKTELIYLHTDDLVDIDRNILRISTEHHMTKNKEARKVAVNDAVKSILKSLDPDKKGFLFPYHVYYTNSYLLNRYRKKIIYPIGIKGNLHQWRHTCASDLGAMGMPDYLIERHLGHVSGSVTFKHYVHFSAEPFLPYLEKLVF